jgi:hypothetical protein
MLLGPLVRYRLPADAPVILRFTTALKMPVTPYTDKVALTTRRS